MSIRIEIKNTELNFKSGNSNRTGKPYEFAEMEGWAHLPGEPYPIKIKFSLPDENKGADGRWNAYPPGNYELDLVKSLSVGKFDRLEITQRLHLKAISAPRATAAA